MSICVDIWIEEVTSLRVKAVFASSSEGTGRIQRKDWIEFLIICIENFKTQYLYFFNSYFAVISIKYVHNHSPDCAAILRYRSPSEQVQEFFRSLFENGVTPSQAFNSYKQHLYEQYSTEYDAVVADRSICPDQRWVSRIPTTRIFWLSFWTNSIIFLIVFRCIISIKNFSSWKVALHPPSKWSHL